MFLQETVRIINGFLRYVEFTQEMSDYHMMRSYSDGDHIVVDFSIDDYTMSAWIDSADELHVINKDTQESVFDYAEEQSWSKEEVRYMRFGGVKPVT